MAVVAAIARRGDDDRLWSSTRPHPPGNFAFEQDRALLDQYEQIRAALADDNLRDARVAAGTMSLSLKPADDKTPKPPLYALRRSFPLRPLWTARARFLKR